ncbi:aminoglycoside phosphotransferase [Streptomyces sp. NPDC047072]|uniref:aminoglycoside phosphotransferase n=1 Tax=Streptomyces sp. NPDC047072 TaxID=3154809 RepID=UPI0033C4861A
MSITAYTFEDLPQEVRRTVEAQTGRVSGARRDRHPVGCELAAFLDTERGTVFMKAAPVDSPTALPLVREATITPHLPNACPRLLWRVDADGWLMTGFQAIDGYRANFTNSGDLTYVIDALREVSLAHIPDEYASFWQLTEIDWAEQRYARYADEGMAKHFAGRTLLHTDIGPHSILIDKYAYIVDWVRPARGAPFIDPFGMVLRMMEAGHQVGHALSWVRRLPSWRQATPEALRAFATVTVRMWREIAEVDPGAVAMASHASELKAYLLKNTWT